MPHRSSISRLQDVSWSIANCTACSIFMLFMKSVFKSRLGDCSPEITDLVDACGVIRNRHFVMMADGAVCRGETSIEMVHLMAVTDNGWTSHRSDFNRVNAYFNLLEADALVQQFLAHPPHEFAAFVLPEGVPAFSTRRY